MNLQELFERYKDISISIIKALENDNIDLVNDLLLNRQDVLKHIFQQGSKEELEDLYEKLDLTKVDSVMAEKFKEKMDNLKKEMFQLRKSKEASKSYNNLNARAVYLSKKI